VCGGFFGGGGSGFKPYSTYSTKGKSQRFFRYVDIAGTSVGLSVQTDFVFDIYSVAREIFHAWFLVSKTVRDLYTRCWIYYREHCIALTPQPLRN